MKKNLLFFFSLLTSFTVFSQDFSNKGRDFWVGYGYHQGMISGNAQDMVLYIATEQITTVTISIPGTGYTQTISNIPANTVITSNTIPKTGTLDSRLILESTVGENKGIHIQADKPVVAYAHVYSASVSGATILFPTSTLGREYYSVNFDNVSNSAGANCWFYVIAADTGTTVVQITPSAATINHAANVPFVVSLTQGQIYNVMGQLTGSVGSTYTGVDLSGSKIKSLASGTGVCKRIGVFSGSGRISITCNGLSSSSDNYMVQAFPKSAWGKKYLTVPAASDQAYNIFRVSVTDPTTIVKLNGVIINTPLVNNFYYQTARTNVPNLIEADKPVLVSQYLTSRGQCGNGSPNGDPEVIYLSPVEQNINRVLWNATPNFKILLHYFNVVLPNSGTAISSFRLDGAVPSGTFVVHPQNSNFVYLQQQVSQGQHIIQSDSGFNAIAYGYGGAESYGYNAGTNIKDLYNFITPLSPLSIATNPVACVGMPFNFAVTFPFQPTSLLWDFHGLQTNVNDAAPVSDSTYFIGARQVWRYQIPKSFTYLVANPSPGFPVTITAGTTNPEGCGNSFDRDFSLAIYEPPVLGFKAENNGCISDSLLFTDTTNYLSGTYPYKWWWDFGDGTFSTSKNPKHLYLTGGTYKVRYSVISNVGCLSDTATRSYTLAFDPVPNFSITSSICNGKPTSFSGSSDQANGTIAKWIWDFGDGVKDTSLSNSNNTHIYTLTGNKTASLKVQSNSGCISVAVKNTFLVNPIPVANFSLPAGVCLPKDSATFMDISTIADNTMSTFTYAWTFGEPASGINDSSILKDPKHNYSSVGPFNINLKTTSAAGCFHDTTKVLSKIYPQALADFTVNPENCLNDSTFFTSKSNGSGSTITNWFWDFGDGSPISVSENPSHLYTSFGTQTIKHWVTTDKGCVSDTMVKTIIVNPLPSANFGSSTIACETKSISFTDISTLSSDLINGWQWVFNDPAGTANNTSVLQNPAHTFALAGNYNVTLIATSNKGCISNILSKQVTINPLPVANFTLPTGVCLPRDSATFIDMSTIADNTISTFTYQWSFGDPANGLNDNSNLKDPQHYYTTVGPFNINLKTTSGTGCFHDTTLVLSKIYPQAIADFSVNPENCLHDSTFFTSKSNGSGSTITNWYWDFGDGSPTSVSQNPSHLYTSFGTKTIKHWSSTDKGCISDTMVKTIIVNHLPSANFSSTIACETKSLGFTDISTLSSGSVNAWQWSFNDPSSTTNNTSALQNPTHIFALAGNYNVTLIATSSKGCISNIFSKQVTVNPLPVADFTLPNGVCLPKDSATFIDISTIADNTSSTFTHQWSFGDPASGLKDNSNLKDPKHYYTTAGPFNINLKTTSGTGCFHDTTKVFSTIYPQAIADFSVNPENCLNDSTFFTSKSNGSGSTITNWYWDFGDGSPISVSQNPSHLYTSFGSKTIKHWSSTDKGCISDTMVKTIIVNRLPSANFSSGTLACETKSLNFTDISTLSSGSVNAWQWSFNDPSSTTNNTSTLQNPTHIFALAGNYSVTLIATSNKGCVSNIFSKQVTINPLPVANFTFPNGVCLPKDSATFIDISSIANNTTSTFTHQWSFGDPASGLKDNSNLKDPKHYYTTVGPFNINLKITSATGCFHDTTKIFNNIFPQAIADFSVAPENCLNDSTFFTSKSNGSGSTITNWYWDFGDGSPTGVDENPSHLYTSFGTKTIRHWASTDKGCISDTMVKTIIVNRSPSANFSSSTLACETKSVSFTDISTISSGSINGWQWVFNDPTSGADNTSVLQNPTHIFAAAGNYNVTLIATSNKGCFSNIFSKQVTINPLPVANFALPNSVCLPKDSAMFSNLSTIANNTTSTFTYQWSFGDPASGLKNTSILKDPKHYYNTVGPFNINLKTTSAAGCFHDTTQVLGNIYPQPIADFSVAPENCLNDTTFLFSKSNGSGSTITNWYWDFGDGSPTGVGQNPSHVFTTFGTKTIKHWSSTDKGCISDTMARSIFVNRIPSANFTSSTLACETKSISFTDNSTISSGSIIGWQWDFNDPSSTTNNTSTFQNPTHIFASAGTYNVKLIASSNKGCFSNIFTKQVIIDPLPKPGFIVPEVCLSDTYALFEDTSSISSGTITKWLWNFGHPASGVLNNSSLKSPTHSYNAVGPYTVSLNLTSNKGCINQISQGFFVNGGNPVADFTVNNPTGLCANDSVAITNTSTVIPGTITKIEIYWNTLLAPTIYQKDDIPFEGKVYKHLYPNFQFPLTKKYTIRLRAYSGGVCVNDKISIITLNAAPKVSFTKIPDICLDANPYTITQGKETGSVPGTYTYTGSGVSPAGVFNPMTAGAGTHIILYTFTSSAGGCIDTASQPITVYAPPQADFTSSLPACETKNITFTSTSTSSVGTLNSYSWNFGDGSPVVTQNSPVPITHIFKTYGDYNVSLNVTTSNGCVSTDKIILVSVYPQPSPNFTFPAIACLPAAEIMFSNTSSIKDGSENAFTYLWNFGDPSNGVNNNTSIGKSPTHIYSGMGPYNIKLQVTTNNGCINDTTIILNTIHPQPKASFRINKPSVCLKEMVTFTDLSNGLDGSVKSWNWEMGDGTKETLNNPSHLYKTDGVFSISLFITNSYGCYSDTTTQAFTVYPNPLINAGPDRVVLEGGSLTLEAVSSGNDLQYLWSPLSYLSSNAILTPLVINPLNDITYNVLVTARGGCTATDDVFVKVLKSPSIPNTFTPNGDGINDRWTIKYLESYPNCKIQVFTRSGQLVYETNAYTDATAWDGTYKNKSLPIDTYYYILEPGSGRKPVTGYVTILK